MKRYGSCLLGLFWTLLLGIWWAQPGGGTGDLAGTPGITIYAPDPQHLWNRLYAILFVRSAADGQAFGLDEIDPLLWSDSRYLLTEPGHDRAIALLDEFLLAGRSGGLAAVNSEDAEFDLLSGPDEDLFEKASGGWGRRRAPARTENLRSCMSCHAQEPGIHSVLTYQRIPPPDLVESDRDRQARAALSWKKLQSSWGLLAGLTEDQH